MAAVLDFTKPSRVPKVDPADFERGHPWLHKSRREKWYTKFPGSVQKYIPRAALIKLFGTYKERQLVRTTITTNDGQWWPVEPLTQLMNCIEKRRKNEIYNTCCFIIMLEKYTQLQLVDRVLEYWSSNIHSLATPVAFVLLSYHISFYVHQFLQGVLNPSYRSYIKTLYLALPLLASWKWIPSGLSIFSQLQLEEWCSDTDSEIIYDVFLKICVVTLMHWL